MSFMCNDFAAIYGAFEDMRTRGAEALSDPFNVAVFKYHLEHYGIDEAFRLFEPRGIVL